MRTIGYLLNNIPNHGGMSITTRLYPARYTNKEEAAVILKNLSKKRDELLGRNDLCVCGSGKKQKMCHKNISENSLVYLLWEKNLAFDKEVLRLASKHDVSFYCSKINCSECCHEYFYISATEYFLIKNHIIETLGYDMLDRIIAKSREMLDALKQEHLEEYNKLESNKVDIDKMFDDKDNLSVFLPCPLLDEVGKCLCYNARPLICRFLGTSSLYSGCIKIDGYLSQNPRVKRENVMIEIAYDDRFSENVDIGTSAKGAKIIQKPYPMFYFFANDERYEKSYRHAVERSAGEYWQGQV